MCSWIDIVQWKKKIFGKIQIIDFESQNFTVFDNVYSTEGKTQKLFIGLDIGLERKRRPYIMCDSPRQKLY